MFVKMEKLENSPTLAHMI